MLEKNMKMVHFFGFWIDRKEHRGLKFYLRRICVIYLFVFVAHTMFFGHPLYILKHSDNFSEISEALGNELSSLLPAVMFITFITQSDKLTELVEILEKVNDYEHLSDEYTNRISENTKKLYDFLTGKFPKMLCVIVPLESFLLAIDVIIGGDLENRLKVVWLIDINQPIAFGAVCILFGINFLLAIGVMVSGYGMIVCMFSNILAQLKFLNHKIVNLRSSAEDAVRSKRGAKHETSSSIRSRATASDDLAITFLEIKEENKTNQEKDLNLEDTEEELDSLEVIEIELNMNMSLAECISHHCEILRFIRKFEEFWNLFFCTNVVVCLAQSVLMLISSSMKSGSPNLLVHFGIMGSYYFMFGMVCYASQKVTEETELLQESIYGCGWTDSRETFKRSIGIIISMTNQPIVMSVAGYLPLTMETYGSLLNSAYSSYMVLKSFE